MKLNFGKILAMSNRICSAQEVQRTLAQANLATSALIKCVAPEQLRLTNQNLLYRVDHRLRVLTVGQRRDDGQQP
jgi:hypothetical protein